MAQRPTRTIATTTTTTAITPFLFIGVLEGKGHGSGGQSQKVVGMPGFEPGTSCTPSRRASQAALHPDSRVRRYDARRRLLAAILAGGFAIGRRGWRERSCVERARPRPQRPGARRHELQFRRVRLPAIATQQPHDRFEPAAHLPQPRSRHIAEHIVDVAPRRPTGRAVPLRAAAGRRPASALRRTRAA